MNERNQFKEVNSIKFNKTFSTDEDCYRYLAEIKWNETEFHCKKCGYTKYCKGVKPFSRRCMKCKYDESPTAGTLFDKCKFPLLLAFHIAFKISTKKKGMSSLELSREFELRQKTCWEFKWKIQQAMQSSKLHPISGIVHVDEFYIGGPDKIKAKYPGMHIIANSPLSNDSLRDKLYHNVSVKIADEHYYQSVGWCIKNFHRFDSYDRKGPKIYIGEFGVTNDPAFKINNDLNNLRL